MLLLLSPDGIASFKRVLDELREARNDPQKFAKQIKSTLKDQSIEQFADEITLVDNAGLFTETPLIQMLHLK